MKTADSAAASNEATRRIPIRNVWYLLLYAWDMTAWRGTSPAEAEESPSLLGLLARILAEATRRLLRQALGRAFAGQRECVPGVRGRIDFGRSLKRLAFQAGRAECTFPTLQIDTLRNRILRATLHRLAQDPRVDHTDPAKADALQQDLRRLVREMEGVALVPVTTASFSQLQLGRNDRDYALPLAVCALIHRLEMPTEAAGDHALAALLGDEVKFHALFERFVRNFWRYNLKDYDVGSETLNWGDELGNALVPSMRTDITITRRAAPHRRLVVDTKYSITTLATGLYGTRKFKSENLYQIYAYLRTQEHRSASHQVAEGMLLYPTIQVELDQAMRVQGHTIRVATINLALEWHAVEACLILLAGPKGG